MKHIDAFVVNSKEMSLSLGRYIEERTEVVLLSHSDSGRYILATDTVGYIVFRKLRLDEEKAEGVFEFVSYQPLTRGDDFCKIQECEWREDGGCVLIFYSGLKFVCVASEIVFDEDLFNRTDRSFGSRNKVRRKVRFNGTDFRCTIRNYTLDKDIPDEIEQILSRLHKRVFENGVFRFYENYLLEYNAAVFLGKDKNSNITYGGVINSPRHLYDIICEEYGVDKNNDAEFSLVFRFSDDCILIMETTRI